MKHTQSNTQHTCTVARRQVLLLGQSFHVTDPGGSGPDTSCHLVQGASLGLGHQKQDESPGRHAQEGRHLHTAQRTVRERRCKLLWFVFVCVSVHLSGVGVIEVPRQHGVSQSICWSPFSPLFRLTTVSAHVPMLACLCVRVCVLVCE